MLIGIHLSHFGVLYDAGFGLSVEDLKRQINGDDSIEQLRCAVRPLTSLIGRNSTGKSALFEALAYLSDCLLHGVPFASTRKGRGGYARLLTFGHHDRMSFDLLLWHERGRCFLRYEIGLGCDEHLRPYVDYERNTSIPYDTNAQPAEQILLDLVNGEGRIWENEQFKKTAVADQKFPALSVYGSIRSYPELRFLFHQISRWYFFLPKNLEMATDPEESGGHRHLNESASNVRNVLDYYRKEHAKAYAGMIHRISRHIPDGRRIDEAFMEGEVTSGSLRLFALLLLLEDPHPRPLICLEEPDSGLYHDMVDVLAHEMRDYTLRNQGCQILFTTHNPYILESLTPDEVWVFERRPGGDQTGSGHTMASARCIGCDPVVSAMYQQGVGMGALWYGGHFDKETDETGKSDDMSKSDEINKRTK